MGPEAASFSIKASAFSGEADILAGESAAERVDGNSIGSKACCGEGADVVVARDSWPVLSEDSLAEWIDFAEGSGSQAGSFEAECKSANACKEIEDIHFPFKSFLDALAQLTLVSVNFH